jgi:beta-lactamase class A
MTALAQADERDLDLGERVVIRREDLTLFHQPIRDIVRRQGMFSSDYADLIDRALTRSDNTANDRILRRVGGPEEVEEFLDDRDIEGIRFGPDERTKQSAIAGLTWNQSYSYGNSFYEARDEVPDAVRRSAFESYLADPIDGATAEGIALALGRLVRGELLSSVSTEYLLQILSETRSGPNRLKGGLPPGWTIAHKTGTGQFFDGEQSGYNDVGVVTSDSGNQYGVAVLIARTRSSYAARMGMMHEVVRAIETYENREYAAAVDAA